jgi:hypothetical protein
VFTARYGLTLYTSQCTLNSKGAVPWLKQLVADLWTQRSGFSSSTFRLGYVVEKMWHCNSFFSVLQFHPLSIIPPKLYTLHLMSLVPDERSLKFLRQLFNLVHLLIPITLTITHLSLVIVSLILISPWYTAYQFNYLCPNFFVNSSKISSFLSGNFMSMLTSNSKWCCSPVYCFVF